MSVFLLPRSVIAKLEKGIRRFWWGELGEKRKAHWIA